MEIEKIFNDLESNQMQECEEAKKKLVDLIMQNKEQWLVHNMMEYFLSTGSLRIMEVLVKVQAPHDGFIFDVLSEWLKKPTLRVQALNLFFFVVRKHPTWLFKVEKHRLFKDIFKLLSTEKEIVPLMSALLCIIALLPIIPNLVPNFLNDLFDVFGHLASWNCQNPNQLPDDKLVHLQLGLQMLFHRLYGMYPWNFLAFLSDFIKKEKGAIFHHTIKPLLETVRVHPMLVTASTDTELSSSRWKEMEPHDVVEACAKLSLPVSQQELSSEQTPVNVASCDWFDSTGGLATPNISSNRDSQLGLTYQFKESQLTHSFGGSSDSNAIIWSPYSEINLSSAIPLTPTPSYVLTSSTSSNLNSQLLSLTGSSPPEAAVEATPETTPMKDITKDYKLRAVNMSGAGAANPHAVRAILNSSQPSSPMRKEHQFSFPEIASASTTTTMTATAIVDQQVTKQVLTRVTTTLHDRMVQQMVHDRNNLHNPQNLTEGSSLQHDMELLSSVTINKKESFECDNNVTAQGNSPLSHLQLNIAVDHITKGCENCNETDQSMCTAGGLHIPTSRSMQLLAKGIKRRSRMTSYCYNDSSCEKIGSNEKESIVLDTAKFPRSKSCSSMYLSTTRQEDEDFGIFNRNNERRLQKSGKMIAIASARQNVKTNANLNTISLTSRITQTIQTWPQIYENILFEMFEENSRLRYGAINKKDSSSFPQEILDQYIMRTIKSKESFDAGYRMDKEQFHLLCLQLQYERYRREIHAERNRRLMGRSRDKRSLEMERDRLREQLKNFASKNEELMQQIDKQTKVTNEHHEIYINEVVALKAKYQNELDQNKCLRQANENLQTRLTEELLNRKEMNYELESLRGQIFNMNTECQHSQLQAEMGLQCKQELARLEAEFVVMGEVQLKCRDRLAEMDNYRARDEEMMMLQESYNIELKELKHTLEEKSSQLESAKHKISELQSQLVGNEKVITEQKRLLRTVKDEYEEQFKTLNKKYEVQKAIILQMEEKIFSLYKAHAPVIANACSPDTDKTDIASSMDRNSPLSTSLASSESLSASLRSTDQLRNLQQLVETPLAEGGSIITTTDNKRVAGLDIATSAITVTSVTGKSSAINSTSTSHTFEIPIAAASTSQSSHVAHTHPHLHLQQQQQKPSSSTTNQYQKSARR